LQARALQRMLAAEREMATRLHAAFPDELSEFQAIAVSGALVAVAIYTMERGEPPDRLRANLTWTLDLLGSAMESVSHPGDGPSS
jgi:hypothetical protein